MPQEIVMSTSGEKIATAIENVATATDKTTDAGAMGIKGLLWNNVGNIAAMAIIAGAFMYLQREQVVQARDDRVMFREAVKAINDSADRRYEKAEVTHGKAMEKMGDKIEKMLVTSDAQTNAVKEATVELKESSKELKAAVKLMTKGP